jgi:type II secretory ATPase GspE/PulE/Tfp pilus assembly ATPase PilB-like protein
MRAFLRADPDIIMIGEMRDEETASIGVEASLTGHLVLSTLHTNSAPETVTRLPDMGLDPFNFADAVLGILAQRLVRTLCKSCKESYTATAQEIEEMGMAYGEGYTQVLANASDPITLYRPKGCDDCAGSGYRGRMGLHELLVGSDDIKRAILQTKTIDEIRKIAIHEGMTTLMQDGVQKIFDGHTDFKQVRAVCVR